MISLIKNLIKPMAYRVARVVSRPPFSYGLQAKFVSEKNLWLTANLSYRLNRVRYAPGEKIRIVFLFQAASFWPSWESLWQSLQGDDRFEVTMLVSDDEFNEKVQFLSARSFLEAKKIPYQYVHDVNLTELAPHIVVLQTPYDAGHRPKSLHGVNLSANGYRVIYITYGIEIVDTQKAQRDHFEGSTVNSAWRVYTFSEQLIKDYRKFCPNGGDMVRAIGHPKFDQFYSNKKPEMPSNIIERAGGRKIVLLKLHFPKKVEGEFITPDLKEIQKFIRSIGGYEDLFFVFMPHPKFFELADRYINGQKLAATLDSFENCTQFLDDDYRPVLYNCDYYIMDRSALVVEAALTKRPILFLEPKENTEKFTEPVGKIVNTLYSAFDQKGMRRFIDDVVYAGNDPKCLEREQALMSVLPRNNVPAGESIKEDIYKGMMTELASE